MFVPAKPLQIIRRQYFSKFYSVQINIKQRNKNITEHVVNIILRDLVLLLMMVLLGNNVVGAVLHVSLETKKKYILKQLSQNKRKCM